MSSHSFTLTPNTTGPRSPLNAPSRDNQLNQHDHDEYHEYGEHRGYHEHSEPGEHHEYDSHDEHHEYDGRANLYDHHERLDHRPDRSPDRSQYSKRRKLPDGCIVVIDSNQSSQSVAMPTNQDTTDVCFHDIFDDHHDNTLLSRYKGKQRAINSPFDAEMSDPTRRASVQTLSDQSQGQQSARADALMTLAGYNAQTGTHYLDTLRRLLMVDT